MKKAAFVLFLLFPFVCIAEQVPIFLRVLSCKIEPSSYAGFETPISIEIYAPRDHGEASRAMFAVSMTKSGSSKTDGLRAIVPGTAVFERDGLVGSFQGGNLTLAVKGSRGVATAKDVEGKTIQSVYDCALAR